jgi:hypothetical protein
MPKAKPTRRQKWLPYVRELADLLALKDWQVVVSEEKPDGDAIASVNCCDGRKLATVKLSEGFFSDSIEDQRQTITHELIHCHLAPFWEAVKRKARHDETLVMLMEYSVDGIADAVGPLLPLPKVK